MKAKRTQPQMSEVQITQVPPVVSTHWCLIWKLRVYFYLFDDVMNFFPMTKQLNCSTSISLSYWALL